MWSLKTNCLVLIIIVFSITKYNVNSEDIGKPLLLTPLIESGRIRAAQQASLVTGLPDAPNITSYSGYLTVNKKFKSNMFFWYFPALNKDKKAPLLLWLQGGPGGSSLLGLFIENGPLVLDKHLKASLRQYTWAQEFSMLFIDNPIGAGFSYTQNDLGYAKNQSDVANNLYTALQQFFILFPNERLNDFYITGESYAGKFVPALAYKIHTEGKASNINLKGIVLGNGLTDPITQFVFGEQLFQLGLIDENQKNVFLDKEHKLQNLIKNKQYIEAFNIIDWIFNKDILDFGGYPNSTSYLKNITGLTYYYNYLLDTQPDDMTYYSKYLDIPATRQAIHVGNVQFGSSLIKVRTSLKNDYIQSVKPLMPTLLDNYKVLLYTGNLDIIVSAPATENYIQTIQWSKTQQYSRAQRVIWKVDNQIVGYVKQVDRFVQAVVRNVGHLVPHEAPKAAHNLITRFVRDISFSK
ncbi:venom serine carboxypeptidase-like [Oppia nitens]|uniref:venom serine carboxypeptidase-like n=1 Tax=Oppia nitens TaxID=1686743 RepID=UPI0023DC38FA|nr:venom serine carboxypeptidase-like [Oppia nitens]